MSKEAIEQTENQNLSTDIGSLILTDDAVNVIDNGVWVGDFKGYPGVSFKVRGMGSDIAKKRMADEKAKARIGNEGEVLSEEQLAKVTAKVLADAILLDWKGLTDGGKEVKYTKALADKWLNSRNGEKLALLVLRAAYRVDAEPNAFVEKATKN